MSVHSGPGNLEDFYLTKHPLVKVMSSWFARENGRELSKALPKSRGLGTPRTTGANLKVASELTGGKPACQVVQCLMELRRSHVIVRQVSYR